MPVINLPVEFLVKTSATVELSKEDLKTLESGTLPSSLLKISEEIKKAFVEAAEDFDEFTSGKTIVTIDSIDDCESEFKEDEIEEAE